jgi:hypothetical protein
VRYYTVTVVNRTTDRLASTTVRFATLQADPRPASAEDFRTIPNGLSRGCSVRRAISSTFLTPGGPGAQLFVRDRAGLAGSWRRGLRGRTCCQDRAPWSVFSPQRS